jgi:hypothetical protein
MAGMFQKFTTFVASVFTAEPEPEFDLNAPPVEVLAKVWQRIQAEHEKLCIAPETAPPLHESSIPKYLDLMIQSFVRDRNAIIADTRVKALEVAASSSVSRPVRPLRREGECIEYLLENRILVKLCAMAHTDTPHGMMAIVLLTLKELIAVNPAVLLPSEAVHRAFRTLASVCIENRRAQLRGVVGVAPQEPHVLPGVRLTRAASPAVRASAVGKRGGLSSEPVTPVVSDDESAPKDEAAREQQREGLTKVNELKEKPDTATPQSPAYPPRITSAALGEGEQEAPEFASATSVSSIQLESKPMRFVKVPPAQRMLAQLAHTIWCAVAQSPSMLSCFYSETALSQRFVQDLLILDAVSPWIHAEGGSMGRPNYADISRDAVMIAFSLRDPRIMKYIMSKTGMIPQLVERGIEAFSRFVGSYSQGVSSGHAIPDEVAANAQHSLKVVVERFSYMNSLIMAALHPTVHNASLPSSTPSPLAQALMTEIAHKFCISCVQLALTSGLETQKSGALACVTAISEHISTRAAMRLQHTASMMPIPSMLQATLAGVQPAPFVMRGAVAALPSPSACTALLEAVMTPKSQLTAVAALNLCASLFRQPDTIFFEHHVLKTARQGVTLTDVDALLTTPSGLLAGARICGRGLVDALWLSLHKAAARGADEGVRYRMKYANTVSTDEITSSHKVSFVEWLAAANSTMEELTHKLPRKDAGAPAVGMHPSEAELLIFQHGWTGIDCLQSTPWSAPYVVEAARHSMLQHLQVPQAYGFRYPDPPMQDTGTHLLDAIFHKLHDLMDPRSDPSVFLAVSHCATVLAYHHDPQLFTYLFTVHDEDSGSSSMHKSLFDIVCHLWSEIHKKLATFAASASAACEALGHTRNLLGVTSSKTDRQGRPSAEAEELLKTKKPLLEAYIRLQEFARELLAVVEAHCGLGSVFMLAPNAPTH